MHLVRNSHYSDMITTQKPDRTPTIFFPLSASPWHLSWEQWDLLSLGCPGEEVLRRWIRTHHSVLQGRTRKVRSKDVSNPWFRRKICKVGSRAFRESKHMNILFIEIWIISVVFKCLGNEAKLVSQLWLGRFWSEDPKIPFFVNP